MPFSPGIISAQSRVLGNFFDSTYHSMQLRVERRMARTFSFSASYALSSNRTNQPENTTGSHQQHPESVRSRVALGAVLPRPPSCVRGVVGLEPAAHVRKRDRWARLLNGWTMTGFHRFQSGSPLVFTMGTDVAQNGILQPNGQYALLVPGATADDVRRDHSEHGRHDRACTSTPRRSCRSPACRAASTATPDADLIYGPGGHDHGLCAHALRQSWTGPARCSCAASSSTRSTR